jgi:hypothetical protein
MIYLNQISLDKRILEDYFAMQTKGLTKRAISLIRPRYGRLDGKQSNYASNMYFGRLDPKSPHSYTELSEVRQINLQLKIKKDII